MNRQIKNNLFSEFAINLFKSEYKNKVNNNSNDLWDQFEAECISKAKELKMDYDSLEFDGELIGFRNDEEYNKSEKNFYWTYDDDYDGDPICEYSWI